MLPMGETEKTCRSSRVSNRQVRWRERGVLDLREKRLRRLDIELGCGRQKKETAAPRLTRGWGVTSFYYACPLPPRQRNGSTLCSARPLNPGYFGGTNLARGYFPQRGRSITLGQPPPSSPLGRRSFMSGAILLIGSFDSKGAEYAFL